MCLSGSSENLLVFSSSTFHFRTDQSWIGYHNFLSTVVSIKIFITLFRLKTTKTPPYFERLTHSTPQEGQIKFWVFFSHCSGHDWILLCRNIFSNVHGCRCTAFFFFLNTTPVVGCRPNRAFPYKRSQWRHTSAWDTSKVVLLFSESEDVLIDFVAYPVCELWLLKCLPACI